MGLVSSMNAPRFLTLTERDTGESLSVRMNRLTAAVKRFRRSRAWKQHVSGGVMVWETTRNEAAGTWHPHVHLIVDGQFWSHASLLAEWRSALGGDGSARIEACPDRVKAARYLAKYLAKDTELSSWPAATIRDFAVGMHRRRLIATFGRLYRVNLDLADAEPAMAELPVACVSYASLCSAVAANVDGVRSAAGLLAGLTLTCRSLFGEFVTGGEEQAVKASAADFRVLSEWVLAEEARCIALVAAGERLAPAVASVSVGGLRRRAADPAFSFSSARFRI